MKSIKGIILAGGNGSRLFPLTLGTSKHLLPVYDKPMIYYPLSTLMLAGLRDILIISTTKDVPRYKDLLNNGRQLGLEISYIEQQNPNGIAESFILGSDFIKDDDVCLILGDNIFYGDNFNLYLERAKKNLKSNYSTIFGVQVDNPNDFGVIEYDDELQINQIVEKPEQTQSKTIVSGLYFYTNEVVNLALNLKPSMRGELEITDINNQFLLKKRLKSINLDSQISWIDTGTYDSMLAASRFFKDIEFNSGKKVACIEEIAYKLGYIEHSDLVKIAETMNKSSYGLYLKKIK